MQIKPSLEFKNSMLWGARVVHVGDNGTFCGEFDSAPATGKILKLAESENFGYMTVETANGNRLLRR